MCNSKRCEENKIYSWEREPMSTVRNEMSPFQNTTPIKPVIPSTPRGDMLDEAKGLITGDRNVSYGSPTQNFTNTAEFWTTRLSHKLRDGEKITALDVADLMILLKAARSIAQPKRDTYVDIAGYAACGLEAGLDEGTIKG